MRGATVADIPEGSKEQRDYLSYLLRPLCQHE